jgi:hypothetical protein
MFILKPLLAETGAPRMGKMVIGTVKGDIHDIGKNLVAMMMEGAGFEVAGSGHQQFGREISRGAGSRTARHPWHVGAADHDDALHEGRDRHDEGKGHARGLHRAGRRRAAERGIRRAIGADAYCRDAAVAVETAKTLVARKHNQLNA